MSRTIFEKHHFSKPSQVLFDHVSNEEKIKRQMGVIDNYDLATGVHSRGVAKLVAEYAASGIVKYDEHQLKACVRVAMLHDLGKLSISRLILNNPGVLSEDEWVEIRNHPTDGYHRYAIGFNAREAIPTLLHHSMQLKDYPSAYEQEKAIAIHGLSSRELDEEEALTNTAMISVADHFEARYPIVETDEGENSHRTYDHRQYSVDSLPLLVKASFVEAGKMKKLNLDKLLDSLIDCSHDFLRRK